MNDETWSDDLAVLIADALADGGVIERAEMKRTGEIIAEEICTRLLLGDYPPGATDPSKRSFPPQTGSNPRAG